MVEQHTRWLTVRQNTSTNGRQASSLGRKFTGLSKEDTKMARDTVLSDKDKQAYAAYKFSMSPRGEYLISQALVIAIEQLKAVPDRQREDSNIADMEYLLDEVYPLFKIAEMHINETQLKALQGVLDIAEEDR